MHCRTHWIPHLFISSEDTVYLATMVLTTGGHNLQCHTHFGNVSSDQYFLLCQCFHLNLDRKGKEVNILAQKALGSRDLVKGTYQGWGNQSFSF